MVDLVLLRAELDRPAYAGLSNAAAAVAVMAASVDADQHVSTAAIARLWARRNVLGVARERAGRAALTVAQRATAWQVIEVIDRDVFADLDPRVPAHRTAFLALLDGLVTDGVMTAADRTATIALINQPRTGREVFGTINETDVAMARAL